MNHHIPLTTGNLNLDAAGAAWRVRIKRRLRQKFPSCHYHGGNKGCPNLEFTRALIDAVDLLSPRACGTLLPQERVQ